MLLTLAATNSSPHSTRLKIGIIGAGMIGTTLARRLAAAGHDVVIANSRGPETIDAAALRTGARAVNAADAVDGVDVLIISVPLNRVPEVAPLVQRAADTAIVIDTSNYYPTRDGHISELDDGQIESVWVSEQYQRPVIKAWNAITAQSFEAHATVPGAAERIAIPIAADEIAPKHIAASLVEATGFAAFDAGSLTDSWRQQPGTPAYCTDLTAVELSQALRAADARRSPRRRDLAIAAVEDRFDADGGVGGDWLVQLNRVLYGFVG